MQPCSRETASLLNIFDVGDPSSAEDFLDQILSAADLLKSSWADPSTSTTSPDADPAADFFSGGGNPVQDLFSGFGSSVAAAGGNQFAAAQQFHQPALQAGQSFGATAAGMSQAQPLASGSTDGGGGGGGGGVPAQGKPRVRARRGQATDPHSIAERLRRERIAERMKSLQELVPNANKTDKASMLDEIIDYVKFLQLQVKVLSTSRLGGAPAVAPLAGDRIQPPATATGGGISHVSNSSPNERMAMTEHQVAKMMEDDMGSAMQYLQGKGLCLMPISLATAISTATCHARNAATAPTSPNMSVQSTGNGSTDGAVSIRDSTSVTNAT